MDHTDVPLDETEPSLRPSRRAFLGGIAGAGLAAGLPSAWAQDSESVAGAEGLSKDRIASAEELIGLEMTDAERELMLEDLEELRDGYRHLRQVSIPNDVPPALIFEPTAFEPTAFAPASRTDAAPDAVAASGSGWKVENGADSSEDDDAFHFLPAWRQASLLRGGGLTSVQLTHRALDRLREWDTLLHCVVERTEERALEQAEAADRALDRGRDLGPLHGLPWGAKDLLATAGYSTTWGAVPFKDQRFEHDASAVGRLSRAGAVLSAKLTLGALAWGDVWFGGMTRNPWNPEQGSSGSSAGSASAVAAGLVSFAIGSETLGSIVSPCTRCGATGLRPTFGLVGRSGAMALSWSMDKLGPIARSVEDCALVLEALAGPDAGDPATSGRSFRWRPDIDPSRLRVGVVRGAFDEERDDEEWLANDLKVLEVLEGLDLDLVDITLPAEGKGTLPVNAMSFVLSVEAAAAFDQLTRDNVDDELTRQVRNAWPNVFRQARFIPAVEYVQANRLRTLLMRRMAEVMADIDVFVCTSYGAGSLLTTNLTGHPAVVLPNGFRTDGTPTSITFTGGLFGENELLAVARAYQNATDHHLKRPPLAELRRRMKAKESEQGSEAGENS